MALADYTPPSVVIESDGKPLMKVRGLSLEDVAILVRVHMDDLQKMYEIIQDNRAGSADFLADMVQETVMLKLLSDLPILAGQLIAMAADEPDLSDAARRLPIGLQLKSIMEIMRLTCEDVGGPKALAALVRGMLPNPDTAQTRAATIQ